MASYNEIPVSTLARLVGTLDCPVLPDVRIDEDFDADPHLIPGAVRQPFLDIGWEEILALRMQLRRLQLRMLTNDSVQVFDILRVAHLPSILVSCSRNMAVIALFP